MLPICSPPQPWCPYPASARSACPHATLTPLPFYSQSYSVALYLVRQLTSSELLQRLKTIGVKHPELCKALGENGGTFLWVTEGGLGSLTAGPPFAGWT